MILSERRNNGVAVITLDRPAARNALSLALLEALRRPEILEFARRGNPDVTDLTKLVDGPVTVWTPETPRVDPPLTDMFPRDEFFLNHAQLHSWWPRP